VSVVRKRIWIGVIVVAAVIAGLAAWRFSMRQDQSAPSDCQVARNMIAYNKSQGQVLTRAFDPQQGREASVSDYQQWADHLRGDAARITSADLAVHAHRLADDADKMVELVKKTRSDTSVPADPDAAPSWAQPYADLSKQFRSELVALDRACPA
jgi:hypothetical protein